MIGNSVDVVDEKGVITIIGNLFRGTKGLWDLLTRKNVNRDVVANSDLKRYKHILEMTNAHLVGYKPGGDIHNSRGTKFTKVICKRFPQSRRRTTLRQRWEPYRWLSHCTLIPPARPHFQHCESSPQLRNRSPHAISIVGPKTGFCTLHRPVRKSFPTNPYNLTNVIDVWECDPVDVQILSKYNDKYIYLLT